MRTRTIRTTTIIGIALTSALGLAACGDDDVETSGSPETTAPPGTGADSPAADDGDPDGTGTLAVQLEEVEGVFIEGFEIGLRFETPDGEVIDTALWSEVVAAEGDGSLESFYETVLEREVPAGDVVVLASVNVGIGPPPEVPDVTGELDCRLEVEVPADGRAVVEVSFDGTSDCLRQV